MAGRMIPIGIDGDPVVDRRDQRVFTKLSQPSPLHSNPQTSANAGMSAAIARILDTTRDVDDDDDDLTFIDRLAGAPPPAPKFPFLREADLARFERRTIRHSVLGPLSAWRDHDFADACAWRDLWWSSAGHRRVVCTVLAVRPVAGSEAAVPSKGEALMRKDVDVDVVTCEVAAQGLATATVVNVVGAPAPPAAKKDGDAPEDAAPAEAEADAAAAAAAASPATEAVPKTATGVFVTLNQKNAGGFGAAEPEAFFVRSDRGSVKALRPGSKVMLSLEMSAAILMTSGCPTGSLGTWSVVAGAALPEDAAAAADSDDDAPLMETAQQLSTAKPDAAASPSAKKGRGKKAARFDVELAFTLDPESREAMAEARREEMKRAAKAQAAAAGRGKRSR